MPYEASDAASPRTEAVAPSSREKVPQLPNPIVVQESIWRHGGILSGENDAWTSGTFNRLWCSPKFGSGGGGAAKVSEHSHISAGEVIDEFSASFTREGHELMHLPLKQAAAQANDQPAFKRGSSISTGAKCFFSTHCYIFQVPSFTKLLLKLPKDDIHIQILFRMLACPQELNKFWRPQEHVGGKPSIKMKWLLTVRVCICTRAF